MSVLMLSPGPVLRIVDGVSGNTDDGLNVTTRSISHLFWRVEMAPGVRLSDCLGLLEACPALIDIYKLNHAQALVDQVRMGTVATEVGTTQLHYLEVRRAWNYDARSRTYDGIDLLQLTGVGPMDDSEDQFDADLPHGLARWGVSLMSVRGLLDLPVRLNDQIYLWSSDRRRGRKKQGAIYCREFLLGDVLRAILYQFSWFGPSTMQELGDDLCSD